MDMEILAYLFFILLFVASFGVGIWLEKGPKRS
jgi:hypothetical protein